MICKDCKSTKIKSRLNYSHGKKSKATKHMSCAKCGSTNIEITQDRRRRQRR